MSADSSNRLPRRLPLAPRFTGSTTLVESMRSRRGERAFTLLELLIVIGIIAILATLTIPVLSGLRSRAQRAQCIANLKSLAVAGNLYVQQNGFWPQPNSETNPPQTEEEIANFWVAKFTPFGVSRKSWICPTNQSLLADPEYSQPGNERIDYIATPFDDKPTTPNEWPRQPWFIETGDVHGNGNLIIFTDGSISDLGTEVKNAGSGP